ncbi:MAG: hypothetical protein LBL98_02985 [Ruminococcus sp.]|jgi:non-homologous end joining protein Ku|nr:hypothetical protein [Ruminococcus sp.]
MKKNLPPFPKLSPDFTLEDIRKIRDYDAELFKTMTWEEQKEYYHDAYQRALKEMAELKASGKKFPYPKRIEV